MKLALFSLFLPVLALSQTVYEVPFASQDNTIELTIQNTGFTQEEIKVEVKNNPGWLRFAATEQKITGLGGNEEKTAVFSFSVDRTAPVGELSTLSFVVSATMGQHWTKSITIAVAPPEQFELFQNFPNPFNPTTTIGYQLPAPGRVVLKVYDLIGQEVAVLVDGERPAGYHQESWDAWRFASGMYVFELAAQTSEGKQSVARKRMMVVK